MGTNLCHVQGARDGWEMHLPLRNLHSEGQTKPYCARNPKEFQHLSAAGSIWGQRGIGCFLVPPPHPPQVRLSSDLADLETPLSLSPLGVVSS